MHDRAALAESVTFTADIPLVRLVTDADWVFLVAEASETFDGGVLSVVMGLASAEAAFFWPPREDACLLSRFWAWRFLAASEGISYLVLVGCSYSTGRI